MYSSHQNEANKPIIDDILHFFDGNALLISYLFKTHFDMYKVFCFNIYNNDVKHI